MPFDSPDYDLAELLKDAGSGKIQLPDFQREWKWEDSRIASLLASVSLGYPIGVVMMLEVGGDSVRFAPKPLAGVAVGARPPEFLLLDGQQRMTSLYQALYSDKPVATTDARGKKLNRWYYIDIEKSLDESQDREEAVFSVREDRTIREDFDRVVVADYSTAEKEFDALVFPLNRLFHHASFVEWQTQFLTTDPTKAVERALLWNRFQTGVLENINRYKLPAIILNRNTPKDAVCVVFEKVNTGGVPLNVFELLTASFAAEGFNLKTSWESQKAKLDKRPVLRAIENTDFLQALTLLATRDRREAFAAAAEEGLAPGISCKRKDVLKLTVGEYRRWADQVTEGFIWASQFLAAQFVFRASDLPYRTQLIPLAVVKVVLGGAADTYAAAEKLRQWYWSGVLGELYGGTTETRMARDLEQVVPWIREEGPAPITVAEATFRAGRLMTMKTRLSAAYKGVHALLMRQGGRDWIKDEPINMATFFDQQIDIHHVFPKAWCNRVGIDENRRESVVNKTPLSYSTNRTIGGDSPSAYMPRVDKAAGVSPTSVDAVVARHAIDPAALRAADFETFFQHRWEALLGLIETAMGKEPVRDDLTDADATGFVEEPDENEDELLLDDVAVPAMSSSPGER